MNKKTKGLVAGTAGAALLLGGATFALWSDSTDVSAGPVTAGNLEIGPATQSWQDVSTDRTDGPHDIDNIADFRIIPGDRLQATFSLQAALEGDNMVAELNIGDWGNVKHELGDALKDAGYAIYQGEQQIAVGDLFHGHKVLFASRDNVQADDLLKLPSEVSADDAITVVVDLEFSEDASLDLTGASSELEDLELTLTQVRGADALGAGGY